MCMNFYIHTCKEEVSSLYTSLRTHSCDLMKHSTLLMASNKAECKRVHLLNKEFLSKLLKSVISVYPHSFLLALTCFFSAIKHLHKNVKTFTRVTRHFSKNQREVKFNPPQLL